MTQSVVKLEYAYISMIILAPLIMKVTM